MNNLYNIVVEDVWIDERNNARRTSVKGERNCPNCWSKTDYGYQGEVQTNLDSKQFKCLNCGVVYMFTRDDITSVFEAIKEIRK